MKLPPVGTVIEITDGPLKGLRATVSSHCGINGEKDASAVMFSVDAEMVKILSADGLPPNMQGLEVGQWFAMPPNMVRQVLQ